MELKQTISGNRDKIFFLNNEEIDERPSYIRPFASKRQKNHEVIAMKH